MVGTGLTGHAESVQVTYDPRHISCVHYLEHNPDAPGIVYNDTPKLRHLEQQFAERLKHR